MATMQQAKAEAFVSDITDYAKAYAEAARSEQQYAMEGDRVQREAIARLMTQVNPTSKDGKLHSASSAKEYLDTDTAYAAWAMGRRDAGYITIVTKGEYEQAKLRARLAIAALEQDG